MTGDSNHDKATMERVETGGITGDNSGAGQPRNAIILIPGMRAARKGDERKRFIDNMTTVGEESTCSRVPAPELDNLGERIVINYGNDNTRIVDVYEVYWNNYIPNVTNGSEIQKILRGATLLRFWSSTEITGNGGSESLYFKFSIMLIATIMCVWYLSILLLFLDASLDKEAVPLFPQSWTEYLHYSIAGMANWYLCLIAGFGVLFMPVNKLINMSDFIKRYVSHEGVEGDSIPVKSEIVKEVRELHQTINEKIPYDRILFVGHSFGSVIAVDFLAEGILYKERQYGLITLGSILRLLKSRETWISREVKTCQERGKIIFWHDLRIDRDWLSNGAGMTVINEKRKEILVNRPGALLDDLVSKTHDRYFDNQKIAEYIMQAFNHDSLWEESPETA